MPKLLLRVGTAGPDPLPQDGDIISVLPDNQDFNDYEYTKWYVIKVDDFTEAMAGILCESLRNNDPDNPFIIKKRLRNVNWRKDLGLTDDEIKDIDNKDLKVNHTVAKSFLRTNIIKVKS